MDNDDGSSSLNRALARRGLSQENEAFEDDKGRSLILLLPSELLLHIARQLVQVGTPDKGLSLFRRPNYSALCALSRCHSRLQRACVEAGMYMRVTPSTSQERPMSLRDFRRFGDFLCQQPYRPRMASLGIDLSNSSVWDMCARILDAFPDLNELVLTGTARAKRYQRSELRSMLTKFTGTSLVLRHLRLTDLSFQVLLDLQRSKITSLFLEESSLLTRPNSMFFLDNRIRKFPGVSGPLFPNLDRVKYVGLPWSASRHLLTERTLCECFIAGSRIKHFEVGSFGFKPRIGGRPARDDESLFREAWKVEKNKLHHSMRHYLLWMLHQHCSDSLETYSEHEQIAGPYFGRGRPWDSPSNLPSLFNIKILIFRCRDLNSLATFDGADDCTVGVRSRDLALPGWQNHSAWMYMATIYQHFPRCDCILIQREDRELSVPESWWEFPSQRLFGKLQGTECLRYFLVGNPDGFYSGIERRMDELLFRNPRDHVSSSYRELESSEECSRIVADRWNSSNRV